MESHQNIERAILRHMIAAMVYRATRTIENAPSEFGAYRAQDQSRTPLQILSHLSDLCDWALTMSLGRERWHDATPQSWESETSRFYQSVKHLDDYLAGTSPVVCSVSRLIQGPVADAISHVGQLAMLRRMSGRPIRGENFFVADIEAGRVGPDQAPPRKTFE